MARDDYAAKFVRILEPNLFGTNLSPLAVMILDDFHPFRTIDQKRKWNAICSECRTVADKLDSPAYMYMHHSHVGIALRN